MKNQIKMKTYISPTFNLRKISIKEDILGASTPGGGNWGYFDEDTTAPSGPTPPFDDSEFWD